MGLFHYASPGSSAYRRRLGLQIFMRASSSALVLTLASPGDWRSFSTGSRCLFACVYFYQVPLVLGGYFRYAAACQAVSLHGCSSTNAASNLLLLIGCSTLALGNSVSALTPMFSEVPALSSLSGPLRFFYECACVLCAHAVCDIWVCCRYSRVLPAIRLLLGV